MPRAIPQRRFSADAVWSTRREVARNWLALGLLLAAWNAADNDVPGAEQRRPEALRGYEFVSVRAAQRAAPEAP